MARKSLANRKSRSAILKMAAIDWCIKHRYSANVELGVMPWGARRADVIAVSVRGDIVIVEVKSCQADLEADSKWRAYLPYCDRFFFCVGNDHWNSHKEAILQTLKGTTAGLMVLEPDGYVRVKKYSGANTMSVENRFHILGRMAWRGGEFNRSKNHRRRRYLEEADGN